MSNDYGITGGTPAKQSGPPAAYFEREGSSIVVGYVDQVDYFETDYETGEKLTWPDGNAKKGQRWTGVVISTDGVQGGGQRNHAPLNKGDLVTFWGQGSLGYTLRQAAKESPHTHQGVPAMAAGLVVEVQRIADQPPTNPRHNPAKKYTANVRYPTETDGGRSLVEACQRHEADQAAARLAQSISSGPFDDDQATERNGMFTS